MSEMAAEMRVLLFCPSTVSDIAQDFLKVMEKCPNRLKRKISSVANLKARYTAV